MSDNCGSGWSSDSVRPAIITTDDGHELAVIGGNSNIGSMYWDFYNPHGGMTLGVFPAVGSNGPTDMEFSRDRKYLLVASVDGSWHIRWLSCFAAGSLKNVWTYNAGNTGPAIAKISISPNSLLIAASADSNDYGALFSIGGDLLQTFNANGYQSKGYCQAWSSDSNTVYFAAGAYHCQIFAINTITRMVMYTIDVPGTDGGARFQHLAISPDDRFLAVYGPSTLGYPFKIFNLKSRSWETVADDAPAGGLSSYYGSGLAWSPNGKYLAVAMQSSPYLAICQTTAASPTNWTTLPNLPTMPSGGVNAVRFNNNGSVLMVGCTPSAGNPTLLQYDTTVLPWNLLPAVYPMPATSVRRIAGSSNWR